MSDEIMERSFPVSGPTRLRLGNIRGTVNIQTGADDRIDVTAVKQLETGNGENTLIEMKQDEDGRVIVTTRFADDFLRHIFNQPKPCKVDYDVRVPPTCTLHVSGVSSSTKVSGTSGDIELETVSGSLTIEDITGKVAFSTVSGDVSGVGLSGSSLRMNTVSGSVDIKQADFPTIEGKTVSGDVRIETPLGNGPYHFNSVSGDVLLTVPADTRCTVRVKGISASIKSNLPLTTEQRKNGSHFAQVMGGGVLVELNTVSGDLILHTDQEVEVRFKPEQPPRSSRKEILDKIERGEMSVDEGVQALKS